MTVPTTTLYRMANAKADGQLAELIQRLRSEGESWGRISTTLAVDCDLVLTAETLRRWFGDLDKATS